MQSCNKALSEAKARMNTTPAAFIDVVSSQQILLTNHLLGNCSENMMLELLRYKSSSKSNSAISLYPPQTVFGVGGIYCFNVVLPSVRPSFRPQHIKSLNEIHETW